MKRENITNEMTAIILEYTEYVPRKSATMLKIIIHNKATNNPNPNQKPSCIPIDNKNAPNINIDAKIDIVDKIAVFMIAGSVRSRKNESVYPVNVENNEKTIILM